LSAECLFLKNNIESRTNKMLSSGAINEVEQALMVCNTPDSTLLSFKAIGVKEITHYLRGLVELKYVEEQINIKTKQYAKRQRTWFRNKFKTWTILPISNHFDLKNAAQIIGNRSKF
jgi:tRNA dimethylallyltransferase